MTDAPTPAPLTAEELDALGAAAELAERSHCLDTHAAVHPKVLRRLLAARAQHSSPDVTAAGEHLLRKAQEWGWPNDGGEGAFEFVSRRLYEQGAADHPLPEGLREKIARIIDPTAWRNEDGYLIEQEHSGPALEKADQILAALTVQDREGSHD